MFHAVVLSETQYKLLQLRKSHTLAFSGLDREVPRLDQVADPQDGNGVNQDLKGKKWKQSHIFLQMIVTTEG